MLAVTALAGCALLPVPEADREALMLAAHHEYQQRYLDAGARERRDMLGETAEAADEGDPRANLRRALLRAAPGAGAESLAEAVALFRRLQHSEHLTPGEKRAVRTWQANAETRLHLIRVNVELRAELEEVRQSLSRALGQIEELTRIERELERDNDVSNDPDDR